MARFITFKVLTAMLPFLLHKREGMHWTTSGFLSVFAVSGAAAAMNNYIFLMSWRVWVEPGIMVLRVLLAVAAVLQIGERMDYTSVQRKKFKITLQNPFLTPSISFL